MARKRKDVLEELQKEAEARLAQSPDQRKDSYDRDGEADIQRLLYELRTHQVELQIQNAELQDAYNRLEAARDNYYHLYNFAPVSYLTILKDTMIAEANLRSQELLGTGGTSLVRQTLSSYVHKDDLAFFHGELGEIFMLFQKKSFEIRLRRKDGSIVHARLEGALGGEAPYACKLILFDITELKHAQEELRRSNQLLEQRVIARTAQIGELSSQLCRAEQKERKRLSLVLHDHLQQLLVASRFTLCRLEPGMDQKEFRKFLAQTEQLINEATESARSLAVELSPPVLYDAGLIAALQWLTRWAKEKYSLTVHLNVEKTDVTASEEMNVFLFQASKELFLNAVKHSGVTEVWMTFSSHGPDSFCITIEDRGAGFDPAEIMSREKSGLGLRHTARRLDMMGGRMEIESAPGKGSIFRLIASVQKSAEPVVPD